MDFETFKKELDDDLNRMSRSQLIKALENAGFEFHDDIVPESIPKALVNLKNSTNHYNWKKCRAYLVRFLTHRRELKGLKGESYFTDLMYDVFYKGIDSIQFGQGGEMTIPTIKSHLANALWAFSREPYKSEFMAYVSDSYDYSEKSGNKKYPQF